MLGHRWAEWVCPGKAKSSEEIGRQLRQLRALAAAQNDVRGHLLIAKLMHDVVEAIG